MLVKLMQTNGREVWVNPRRVVAVYTNQDGTKVAVGDDRFTIASTLADTVDRLLAVM